MQRRIKATNLRKKLKKKRQVKEEHIISMSLRGQDSRENKVTSSNSHLKIKIDKVGRN